MNFLQQIPDKEKHERDKAFGLTAGLRRIQRLIIIFLVLMNHVYQEGLADAYRETEGNASVYTTVDLTLESLFTTREPEAIKEMYGKDEKELTAGILLLLVLGTVGRAGTI